jgi:hypothetical protein
MRRVSGSLLSLICLLPASLLAQGGSALLKSDLVRFLTGTTYSQGEIAAIVRRSCLAFTPTARDRRDLRELGATPVVFQAIDGCMQKEQRARAPAAASGRTTAPARPSAPRPVELAIIGRVDTAVVGTTASFPVELQRGSTAVSGMRLVLKGTDSIPGGAQSTPATVTDARGHATFTIPTGTRAGTYQLTVAAADGSPLTGDDAILLTTLPGAAAAAKVSPDTLAIVPGSRDTRELVVALTDSFGNPAARQQVQLRPPPSRPVFPVRTQQTSDSGTARFELSTSALRAGDTLTVAVDGRTIAAIPVTAPRQVATQSNGAPQSAPSGSTGARPDAGRASALTALGYDALRSGNYATAADQFQQALRAAPQQPDAATGLAYAELWRSDPRQAARRSDVLRHSPPAAYSADAAEQFRDGVARVVHRDLPGAERALSAAVAAAPSWADAYYNRALVREAGDQPERAVPDLQRYLQLRPGASDSAAVAARIAALSKTPVDALTRGLMVPGLGQFYTGRPALGAAILAGVAASTALALGQRTTTETRTFTDAFGKRYTDDVTVTKRPHLTTGLAAAGAIWLLGAMEASLHVAGTRGEVPLPSAPNRAPGTSARLRIHPMITLEPTGPAFGAAAVVKFR